MRARRRFRRDCARRLRGTARPSRGRAQRTPGASWRRRRTVAARPRRPPDPFRSARLRAGRRETGAPANSRATARAWLQLPCTPAGALSPWAVVNGAGASRHTFMTSPAACDLDHFGRGAEKCYECVPFGGSEVKLRFEPSLVVALIFLGGVTAAGCRRRSRARPRRLQARQPALQPRRIPAGARRVPQRLSQLRRSVVPVQHRAVRAPARPQARGGARVSRVSQQRARRRQPRRHQQIIAQLDKEIADEQARRRCRRRR